MKKGKKTVAEVELYAFVTKFRDMPDTRQNVISITMRPQNAISLRSSGRNYPQIRSIWSRRTNNLTFRKRHEFQPDLQTFKSNTQPDYVTQLVCC